MKSFTVLFMVHLQFEFTFSLHVKLFKSFRIDPMLRVKPFAAESLFKFLACK